MDITPMIDCTFLLLIFFIVCSHIGQEGAVELPKAKHGATVSAQQSVVLTIGASDSALAKVYRGDKADVQTLIVAADPQSQEEEIARYVESEMRADTKRDALLIKAEKSVKHREVSRIARAASRGTDSRVRNLYIAVMESDE